MRSLMRTSLKSNNIKGYFLIVVAFLVILGLDLKQSSIFGNRYEIPFLPREAHAQ